MARNIPALITFAAALCFLATISLRDQFPPPQSEIPAEVVMPAPAQIILYAGDRFLAANIESVRAAVSVQAPGAAKSSFHLRAHRVVAELNPCHEDNYWIGNTTLTWSGMVDDGMELLKLARDCRYWDEIPPLFYGFNQYFFFHDIAGARNNLEVAAQRSTQNAAIYRTFSLMLAAGEYDDAQLAINMLVQERNKSRDPHLKDMLSKRIIRLEGLVVLRNAQEEYEARFGKSLVHPQELLDTGVLEGFPEDPLRLGYEFRDHMFHLRQAKITN